MNGMMSGMGMTMGSMGLIWLLLIVVVVLVAAAAIKYLFLTSATRTDRFMRLLVAWTLNFRTPFGSRLSTMVRCLRTVLLWLGFIALPLHGVAGVTTRLCLSDGHDLVHAMEAAHSTTVASITPCNHTSEGMSSPSDSPKLVKVKCGTGAVCIASVALATNPLRIAAAAPAAAPAQPVPVSVDRFFTGGPDRPPRTSLA
ncbi:hypothetical protein BURC_01348 [Burkholderiaceae bacterium]|nr:hypothetical protein BURC_01348 [Burkholderiaceae bacterium]